MDYQVHIDLGIFNMDVIKSACYRCADGVSSSLSIDPEDKNKAVVTFSLPHHFDAAKAKDFVDSFNSELIDQDLRQKLRKETETTRNLILAYAFADSKLVEDEESG